MPTAHTCGTCGASFSLNSSPGGLCPACLLSLVVQEVPSPASPGASWSSDLLPGSTLGPFHIIGLLGKGGMASVYEAYDSSLERAVALKVLPPEFLHDESFARRFRQEGRVVARLEHPNIVPIYGSGIDNGIAWMNMRLLTGGSLGALLQRERPAPQRIVEMLRSVADALDHAHTRGVIHRDVKPGNILFDQTDHICVADFGLASIMDFNRRDTSTRTIVGTPQYMAPEVGLGNGFDHRCDIYSLGVVAYEMLSGDLPFTADGPMAILLKHVNDDPPSPSTVPLPLLRAVHKALAKDPAERWSSAGAFVEAMEHALGAGPSRRRPLRRRAIAIAAGAITIASAGVVISRDQPQSVPLLAVGPAPSTDVRSVPAVVAGSAEPTTRVAPEPARIVRERLEPKSVAALPAVASPVAIESTDSTSPSPPQILRAPIELSTSASATSPPEASPSGLASEFVPPAVQRSAPNDVLMQPVRVKTVPPVYPPMARAAQIAGNVLLQATVGRDGAVTDVAVVRSVHPLLDQAARKAVLQYRYNPATRNAIPEVSTVEITVSFRLE